MSESDPENQFVPRDDDEQALWEVIEIVAETGRKYQVRWAGLNPQTGRPWSLDWVPKSDCTPQLVKAWKSKKEEAEAKKQKAKKPAKGKAAAKSKASVASSSKGKGIAKEVIPSDSEAESTQTRSTRTASKKEASKLSKVVAPSSSPIPFVKKVRPPVDPKRKISAEIYGEVGLKHPPSSDDSGPVAVGPVSNGRPKKRRKLNQGSTSPYKAIASRSCPQLDIPKIVDHSIKQDPTLAELPLPPPDLERSPYRSSPFDDEAPYEDSREFGIVPETQPSHVEEENTFQTDYIEADQPAYDSHDERDDVTPDRSRKSSKVSSAIAESNRVLHQALKPVPSISPSVFKPYLPKRPTLSQPASPIEEFESPVRRRGQSSRAVDVPLEDDRLSHPNEAVLTLPGPVPDVDKDIDKWIDYAGGQQVSPIAQKIHRSRSHSSQRQPIIRSASPDDAESPEFSSLPLPATASTQRAVVDSQSRVLMPDSQQPDISIALQEKDDLIAALRKSLQWHEEEVDTLKQRCQDREDEASDLRDKILSLKSEMDSMVPIERVEEQTKTIELMRTEVAELKDTLANIRATAVEGSWKAVYGEQARTLQNDVAYWKGIYEILRKKDERTNDEIRKRAAEEPELRAKLVALQAEKDEMEKEFYDTIAASANELDETRIEHSRTISELLIEKVSLEQLVADSKAREEAAESGRAAAEATARVLQDRIGELEAGLRVESLGKDLFNSQSQDNVSLEIPEEWTCICPRPKDHLECLQIFASREELRRHALSTHCRP